MINYADEEPHTASVKEHAAQLMEDLREFCATHNAAGDYTESAYYIKELGEMLNVLYDHNENDIITITWRDWAGFIAQDREI